MQNIPVVPNVDLTDVTVSVRLIPEACTREMYRPVHAIHLTNFSSSSRDK
jgi:hypothetical protein